MGESPEEVVEEPKDISIEERFKQYLPITTQFGKEFITSPVEGYVISRGGINHRGELLFKKEKPPKDNKNIKLETLIGDGAKEFHGGDYVAFHICSEKLFWVTPYEGKFIYTQENKGEADSSLIIQFEEMIEHVPGISRNFLKRDMFVRAVKEYTSFGSIYETEHFPIAMVAIGSSSTNGIHLAYAEGKQYNKAKPVGYFDEGLGLILCFPGNQRIIPERKGEVVMGEQLVLLGQD